MPGVRAASAVLQVATVIAPRVVVELQSAPSELVLLQRDVERGYVDAPVVVRLRSNLSHPFALELRSAHDAVARIETRSASPPLLHSMGGGVVVPAAVRPQSFTLLVRLFLGPEAVPGTYPWPVRVGGSG